MVVHIRATESGGNTSGSRIAGLSHLASSALVLNSLAIARPRIASQMTAENA